jgi:tripartite-type tricarboxylate transporter receptor subunit TctC
LRVAAKAAAQDAKVREVIGNAGSPILYLDAPEFEDYVRADARSMVDVVRRIGRLE